MMSLCGTSSAIATDEKAPAKSSSQPASLSKALAVTKSSNQPTGSSKATAIQATKSKSAAPVALTAEQRGEKVFKKSYCIGCHADGNNALMPDRPIKGKAFSTKYKDDALLEKTIRKGFPDEGMPAFGRDQISENQMKDLILYIRSFTPTR
ncbi:MAG TPA: cytochrome c [Drouetiella sp.]|jgi:mono/diheme cytochrome c family protein